MSVSVRPKVVVALAAVALTLTACTAIPSPTLSPSTTSRASSASSATETRSTTSSSPIPSSEATMSTTGGCPSTSGTIPAGADQAPVGDIDGDGNPDTEFYSETPHFEFGVHTASGATITIPDGLPGPGVHGGWIQVVTGINAPPVAVIDDGRTATLHAFVHCGFVTPHGVTGQPYTFSLNGFGTHGTGVECTEPVGRSLIAGVQATRRSNGTYDLATTQVTVSTDGTRATNSTPTPSPATFRSPAPKSKPP